MTADSSSKMKTLSISGLTYLLTPWSRVLLEKLTGFAANQEIPRILWNPKVHYRTHKRPPPVPILSQPHPTSSRSILILSSHLRLGLPNGLFPSGFPTKTLCTPLPSSIRATCPAHLNLIDKIKKDEAGGREIHAVKSDGLKKLTELGTNDRTILKCILQKNEYVDLIYLVRIGTCEGHDYGQLDFLRDGELFDLSSEKQPSEVACRR